ncbi:hypothetical protein LTR56_006312 [Elasticomyces elasticus]|nr:hypothetical protein LTR56_006312 [Elasticomyces elasticus]KAK3663360.1 hypothetical protein LTR22_005767 [Elasticomyces elasticus]KAK4925439.1 hypothetical protein LTR49_007503 [Elasticomyces elasticus]KAK5764534.1 hypothetical protein LTS12_005264 [Elasticomyces elasticus]
MQVRLPPLIKTADALAIATGHHRNQDRDFKHGTSSVANSITTPRISHIHAGDWILGNVVDLKPFTHGVVRWTGSAVVLSLQTSATEAMFPVQQEQCLYAMQNVAVVLGV